jgi:peptidoglycan/xylan/chitin deacetylase (PgdA/CDA1 family)
MKLSKRIYYGASSFLPTGGLKRIVPRTTLLPYHHLVSDSDVLHVKHLYSYKNIAQFTEDLEHLLKYFRPVAVSEVVDAVASGRKMPENAFLLSFDDGFREVYDVIAPILSSRGVPAIFFINPAFLDNRELFYRCKISLVIEGLNQKKNNGTVLTASAAILGKAASSTFEELVAAVKKITQLDKGLLESLAVLLELSFDDYLRENKPFLTTDQVRQLSGKGFSIGAHSWDHPYYQLVSPEEQQRQTMDSIRYVKDHFSPPFDLFSFPHSDQVLPDSFFQRLREKEGDIDLFFGIQNQKHETANRVLHRFNAERPEISMSKQLNGVLLLMMLQRMLKKDRVERK